MLLKLYREQQELSQQAFELLRAEYKLTKATHKLEHFLQLGWNEFVEELEKQRIKLTFTQKDELHSWFKGKQKNYTNISEAIKRLNDEIDKLVYGLYRLSEDEIKLIEKEI